MENLLKNHLKSYAQKKAIISLFLYFYLILFQMFSDIIDLI